MTSCIISVDYKDQQCTSKSCKKKILPLVKVFDVYNDIEYRYENTTAVDALIEAYTSDFEKSGAVVADKNILMDKIIHSRRSISLGKFSATCGMVD